MKIKINKVFQPQLAVSKYEGYPALCHPFVHNGRLVCTDGNSLVSYPIQEIEGVPALDQRVNNKLFKLKKHGQIEKRTGLLVIEDGITSGTMTVQFNDCPGATTSPPDVEPALNSCKKGFRLGLDIYLLNKIVKSMGSKKGHVNLTWGQEGEPVMVDVIDGHGAFGIIMPLHPRD